MGINRSRNLSMTFGRPLCLSSVKVPFELPSEVVGEPVFYDLNGEKIQMVAFFSAST